MVKASIIQTSFHIDPVHRKNGWSLLVSPPERPLVDDFKPHS